MVVICEKSLGMCVIAFFVSFIISIVTFTFSYRETENLKSYKPKGWRKQCAKIWAWQIGLIIVLILISLLPLFIVEQPNCI